MPYTSTYATHWFLSNAKRETSPKKNKNTKSKWDFDQFRTCQRHTIRNHVMSNLHSRLRYSSRLLVRCEQDEVRTNVDTLVQELSIMRQDIRDLLSFFFDSGLIYWHVLESFEMRREQNEYGRWDECTLHTHLVSCCLDVNVNQAFDKTLLENCSNFSYSLFKISRKCSLFF